MADAPGSNFVGKLEDILGAPDEFKDAFELESTEEEATDTDEEPVEETATDENTEGTDEDADAQNSDSGQNESESEQDS